MNNVVMVRFKRELLSYEQRIVRAAHIKKLEVVDLADGDFKLVASWDGGSYEKLFDKNEVMGRFAVAAPLQQRPRGRPCMFRDQFVQAVLAARGV